MKSLENAVHDRLAERAQRYAIQAPIRFRGRREKKWREGVLLNISTTGLLIKTRQICEMGMPLEMRFVLPVNVYGKDAAELFCSGKVIRIEDPLAPGSDGLLAATIERSQLVRSAT